jgi:tRNA A-37 threonylcarbamoyl transferase component Bud32
MDDTVLLNGRYRLLSVIGKGGMAVVYRAHDKELNRIVAIKVLRPERSQDADFLKRFCQEAQASASLAHPNIVAVYEVGHAQDGDLHYVVMEWVEGVDLRQLLSRGAPLPVNQALDLAIQIAAALAYAHRAGRVHGDLKPANILVTGDGRVKVTDFGIAKALAPAPISQGAVIWGTPTYFAPEQAAGEPVFPPVDLYALGVILYEMLAGQPPFAGASDFETALKHLEEDPPPLERLNPRVPAAVAHIVHKLLSREPAARYASAEQASQALIQYCRQIDQVTPMPAPQVQAEDYPLPPGQSVAISKGLVYYTPARQRTPVDWLAVALGLAALALVLGLAPVWATVARSYLGGGIVAPTPPLPTPAPGEVVVPNVVGLDQDLALLTLEQMGLKMSIVGQEHHPTIPALAILRQDVPAGQPLAKGGNIEVVISQGPDLVTVPAVVGLSLGDAERTLSAAHLANAKRGEWSQQPVGTVLMQEPSAESIVVADTQVLLVLSSGTTLPVGARLGPDILLVACDLPKISLRPGETLRVVLRWQALAPIRADYTVFVHLTQTEGQIITQYDSRPVSGSRPTNGWGVGETVEDTYDLRIPLETPPGNYWLLVGMYTDGADQRLPIVDPGYATADRDSLMLHPIQIR